MKIVETTYKRKLYPRKPRKTAYKARRQKKPRKTKISLFREWGVPDRAYKRYSGLKGVYWYWFSKEIRERDYREYGGLCMTCNTYVERSQDQCGHVFAAKDCGFALLFHPLNNHLQHAKCNNPRFTPSAGIYNALTVDKRYGAGTIEMLRNLKESGINKEWPKGEYPSKIAALRSYQLSTQASLSSEPPQPILK